MIKAALIFFFILSLSLVTSAAAMEEFDRHLYIVYTGEDLTFAWDAPTDTEGNPATILRTEMKLFHYEQDSDVLMPLALAKIPFGTYQVTFSLPRWGHWIPHVRFCFLSGTEEQCTDWSKSINAERATVNGTGRAWWLYSHVSPVTQ